MSASETAPAPPAESPRQPFTLLKDADRGTSALPLTTDADEPPRPPAEAAEYGVLARHWNTLGIRPTTDLTELETSFYLVVEKFSRNPTEQEEIQRQEMHRAYGVLRRALVSRGPVVASRFDTPGLTPRQWKIASVVLAASLAGLVYFNVGTLKLGWVEFQPGTVVRFANSSEPYATVVRFDPSHKFAVGPPGRAYQLTLARNDEVVWLSERIVEKGMVPTK